MSSLLTPSIEETRAQVHARDRVIQYRRLGPAGAPAVALLGAQGSDDLWADLPALLASDHRVFVPTLDLTAEILTDSLASLLEGLGITRTCLVAGGSFALPALELAMSAADLVTRLVLVGGANGLDEQGALTTRSSALPMPMLVLPRRIGVSNAHVLLRGFLERAAVPFHER